MNEMKIDLRVIRGWVEKWQEDDGVTRTASKLAAVMLSEVLRENEQRLIMTETVMKEILNESRTLEKVEQQLLIRLKARRVLAVGREPQVDHAHGATPRTLCWLHSAWRAFSVWR